MLKNMHATETGINKHHDLRTALHKRISTSLALGLGFTICFV